MAKIKQISFDRVFYNNFKSVSRKIDDLVFPLLTKEVIYFLTIWSILDVMKLNPFEKYISFVFPENQWGQVIANLLVGFILISSLIQILRFTITLVLYYHGWLFEEIGKVPSLSTKAFMVIIGFLSKRSTFFTWQGVLPWMMPPRVKDTVEKYLKTMKPILDEKEFELLNDQAKEFQETISSGLQNKLWMKWLISKNYLSDWWKEVVYMRYRDSLIRSNVGCADVIYQKTTSNQAARAAYVTLNRQHFCRDIFERNKMKPVSLGGIPLCAQQYSEYHRTLRIPNETSDITVHLGNEATHIAVYHKECWYKIEIIDRKSGKLIKPAELEKSFQNLLDNSEKVRAAQGEKLLSALTCGPRDLWAKIRREKFVDGVNKESLDMIETSLEIVFLDEEERYFDENDNSAYNREYARALHGDGYMLWCDKPSVYIFSKNGRFSSNAEHSPCDAMIYVQVREYIKYHEQYENPYGPDGHCTGKCEKVPKVERLCWDFDEETLDAIDKAYESSKNVAEDFENASCVYTKYGKDFMKKAKVSPDAFIQMALQMAYFKDQGKFEQTYEPAVMRLYKHGRTETVRSCSIDSCDFVQSMLSKDSAKTKLEKLKKACDSHQDYYRQAMAGNGVDRHLFALYVVSKYYQIPSDFLSNVFSRNWSLSTSQTPQHQMMEYSKILNKEPSLFWPAGGFSCPDGSNYGVCYTIGTTGDRMSFHITTWNSIKGTNAKRYLGYLEQSLEEIQKMVEEATSKK
ncbi:unnamed protein product [Caenorhabditis angaria]|uniref:Choline/carnitine acyltransferase domain-containing protein n=1 Tax=Caenorhabditis angaria TaxID=860376 RepID=A0A9P1ITV7_9PELO|nr:unnamed protein product [Caenorhabditis angaria]